MRLRTIYWIVAWPNFFCVRDEICCVPNYFFPTHPVNYFPSSSSFPPFFHLFFRYLSKLISTKPLPSYPLTLRLLKTAKGDSRHHVCLRRFQGPFTLTEFVCWFVIADLLVEPVRSSRYVLMLIDSTHLVIIELLPLLLFYLVGVHIPYYPTMPKFYPALLVLDFLFVFAHPLVNRK